MGAAQVTRPAAMLRVRLDGAAEAVAWVEAHSHLPHASCRVQDDILTDRIHVSVQISDHGSDVGAAAQMAEWARAMAEGQPIGTVTKSESGGGGSLQLTREFGPALLRVWAPRENVCERVKVGTVTVEVPDPAAGPVPMVTVERDVYEWDCAPMLAERVG